MGASNAKRIVLGGCWIAMSAIGWLGCSVGATGSSDTATVSEAVATSTLASVPPEPQCPADGSGITVYALRHQQITPGECGYLGAYVTRFPAPACVLPLEDGGLSSCGQYELDIWDNIQRANGYEYRVSQANPNQGGTVTYFLAVGINDADNLRKYMRPADNAWGVPEPLHAWEYEYTQSQANSGPPIQGTALSCVTVVAADDPTMVLDYFPLMDLHDPSGPNW
jgi:hypothetical protein